jgi:hypothetical protein
VELDYRWQGMTGICGQFSGNSEISAPNKKWEISEPLVNEEIITFLAGNKVTYNNLGC